MSSISQLLRVGVEVLNSKCGIVYIFCYMYFEASVFDSYVFRILIPSLQIYPFTIICYPALSLVMFHLKFSLSDIYIVIFTLTNFA